jgi:hypothetical protein
MLFWLLTLTFNGIRDPSHHHLQGCIDACLSVWLVGGGALLGLLVLVLRRDKDKGSQASEFGRGMTPQASTVLRLVGDHPCPP